MTIRNQVQLITYGDSLGGNLKAFHDLYMRHFTDAFSGGVHILPPFPSSADRGFAPLTYFEIDPALGNWDDIAAIGTHTNVLLDLMVNHISRQSAYFQDFVNQGRRSQYADFFLTLDKVWPGGNPPKEDVAKIFLRKPENPFSEIVVKATGQHEHIWTSFGTRDWSEQIDLDVSSALTRQLMKDILAHMKRHRVKIVRLDAIAFVIKKPGTSCFFVEPEIYEFMDWIRAEADAVSIDLLPEVHAPYSIQSKLADHGYWVYDFALPMLTLHTLMTGSGEKLKEHLRACPRKQFTMLDCHDGIPVQPDLDGILDIDDAQNIVRICVERGANLNRILSFEHRRQPDFDAHQINCTYYSALGENDDTYIAARAIQFFAPGVPQVYYVGLLAGRNDQTGVTLTGEGRAINRHNYAVEEAQTELQRPVVQRLLKLIKFRNECDAFGGDLTVHETEDCLLSVSWKNGNNECRLTVDLDHPRAKIQYTNEAGDWLEYIP